MNKFSAIAFASLAGTALHAATVEQVIVRQQWPWSTDVKVEYKLSGASTAQDLTVKVYDGDALIGDSSSAQSDFRKHVKGDVYGVSAGSGTIVIDPVGAFGKDRPSIADFRVKLEVADTASEMGEVLYKVFDLATGEVEDVTRAQLLNGKKGSVAIDYTDFVSDFDKTKKEVLIWTEVTNNVAYMRDKIVMRRVKAGTFMMGSPESEYGRDATYETAHEVTLTKDYFIGVFEVTQHQYNQFNGDWPSWYILEREERPVDKVSYDTLRGTDKGATWPTNDTHEVDATSAIGKLRAKFNGQYPFDLPTEAQWEMACRAGTTTALYSGKDHDTENVSPTGSTWYYKEPRTDVLCRYQANGGYLPGGTAWAYRIDTKEEYNSVGVTNGSARVGSYLPNAFGLYDMLGNAPEWVLDYHGVYPSQQVTDPKGPAPDEASQDQWGFFRVVRGVGLDNRWVGIRAAARLKKYTRLATTSHDDYGAAFGFRLCLPAE